MSDCRPIPGITDPCGKCPRCRRELEAWEEAERDEQERGNRLIHNMMCNMSHEQKARIYAQWEA